MTDPTLIERLRGEHSVTPQVLECCGGMAPPPTSIYQEAADRIEELEKQVAEAAKEQSE